MPCNSICIQYRAKTKPKGGCYLAGQKRCSECTVFLYWDGLWCPCCSTRLRTTPKNKKYKEQLRVGLENT